MKLIPMAALAAFLLAGAAQAGSAGCTPLAAAVGELLARGGCVVYGTEMTPARLAEMLAGE